MRALQQFALSRVGREVGLSLRRLPYALYELHEALHVGGPLPPSVLVLDFQSPLQAAYGVATPNSLRCELLRCWRY